MIRTAAVTCCVDCDSLKFLFKLFLLPCLTFRFIKGFIYRHKERCPENEYFLDYVRYSFLMKLHRNLPKNVLDKSWPTPPAALTEVYNNTTHRDKNKLLSRVATVTNHISSMLWWPHSHFTLVKCLCGLRHQNICVSCACRTWYGATARRSVLSGNTRWILSHHQSRHALYTVAARSLVCCSLHLLNCHHFCVNRWSRRWSPVRSSRTRRTTTHRACPNCLSAQDSVRFYQNWDFTGFILYTMKSILTACFLLFRWWGHQPQGAAGSGHWEDEG